MDKEHRTCENCGTLLEWKPGEPRRDFLVRKYCNRTCWSEGKRKNWRPRFWAKVEQAGPDDCWLWTGALYEGYGQFLTHSKRSRRAHIIVAEEFHGQGEEGQEVRHLCGVRHCVNPAHLRWGTRQENMRDMVLHGTSRAKLTVEDVRSIRREIAAGEKMVSIARKFGVSDATIYDLKYGRTWGWVNG